MLVLPPDGERKVKWWWSLSTKLAHLQLQNETVRSERDGRVRKESTRCLEEINGKGIRYIRDYMADGANSHWGRGKLIVRYLVLRKTSQGTWNSWEIWCGLQYDPVVQGT